MKFGSSRDLLVDPTLEEIRLKAQDRSETTVCRVSRHALEALVSREGSRPDDLLRIAYDYFELLTEKWAERIQLGLCEIDGSVLLRRRDVLAGQRTNGRPAPARRAVRIQR